MSLDQLCVWISRSMMAVSSGMVSLPHKLQHSSHCSSVAPPRLWQLFGVTWSWHYMSWVSVFHSEKLLGAVLFASVLKVLTIVLREGLGVSPCWVMALYMSILCLPFVMYPRLALNLQSSCCHLKLVSQDLPPGLDLSVVVVLCAWDKVSL